MYIDGGHVRVLVHKLAQDPNLRNLLKQYDVLDRDMSIQDVYKAVAFVYLVFYKVSEHIRLQYDLPIDIKRLFFYYDCLPKEEDTNPRRRRIAAFIRAMNGFSEKDISELSNIGVHARVSLVKGELQEVRSRWSDEISYMAGELIKACAEGMKEAGDLHAGPILEMEEARDAFTRSLQNWVRSIPDVVTALCSEAGKRQRKTKQCRGRSEESLICQPAMKALSLLSEKLDGKIQGRRLPPSIAEYQQKEVDVALATHLVWEAVRSASSSSEVYFGLLADDSDFVPAIKVIGQHYGELSKGEKVPPPITLVSFRINRDLELFRVDKLFKLFVEENIVFVDDIIRNLARELALVDT